MEGGGDQNWDSQSRESTVAKEVLLQNNDIALSAIHDTIDERIFEQIKNIEMKEDESVPDIFYRM